MELLIVVVAALVILTVLYKLLPFRGLGERKPTIAFLPKYRRTIRHSLTDLELEEKLRSFGFKKVSEKDSSVKFSRGSVLGDISIKLAKVNVGLRKISDSEHEVTVEAGWIAGFDTGDHWTFTKELTEKMEGK